MKIALLGDIALFGRYCVNNKSDVLDALSGLKNALSEFDLIVANLEAPLTSNKKRAGSKSAYIRSEINNIEVLKYLGVNAVSLANNHIFDFGLKGLQETLMTLKENNIDYYGVDSKSLNLNIRGEKIALHGYCSYITDPSYASYKDRFSSNDGLNLLEYDDVLSSLKKADEEGYFNIISAHSGIENVSIPSVEDIMFARKLANEFNYVYHGHHPHVIQGLEKHNNSLISYSQGNCLFDDIYDHRTGSLLVEQAFINACSFILSIDIKNKKLSAFKEIPFSLYKGDFVLNCIEAKKVIAERSELLKLDFSELQNLRTSEIKNMKTKRSARRDFKWFKSRLRPSTFFRIFNNKLNAYFYSYKYKNYIKK